jgi:hypothetical protein
VSGAARPYIDRWYFEAGQFVTHRDSDPAQVMKSIQYYIPPTGKNDLDRLKAQLVGALDALSVPHSSQPSESAIRKP